VFRKLWGFNPHLREKGEEMANPTTFDKYIGKEISLKDGRKVIVLGRRKHDYQVSEIGSNKIENVWSFEVKV